MCDVLIVIDNRFREMVASLLIRHFLKQKGISCEFCSRFSMFGAFNRLKPKAVILPNPGEPCIEELAKRAFVFILPSESGNGQVGAILDFLKGYKRYKTYTSSADLVFSWGPLMTEVLLKDQVIAKEKIKTTGSAITDQWFIPREKKQNRVLGIATTFRTVNGSVGGMKNAFRVVRDHENFGEGSYYQAPQHVERWFFYEFSYVRLLGNIIDKVVIGQDINLEIRPHPWEKVKQYHYYEEITKGRCQIVKKGSITEWLQGIDVLATYLSGSAVDAAVMGVPVISFKNLLDPDALAKMSLHYNIDYYPCLWQPSSLEEFTDMVKASFEGRLAVSPQKEKLFSYIANAFYFPRPRLASQNIADEIESFLKQHPARVFAPLKPQGSHYAKAMFHEIMPYVPYSENAFLLYYSLKKWLERDAMSEGIRFTYAPWFLKDIVRSQQTAEKILYSGKVK